jgi:dipeptidyl-peptidase-4
MGLENQRGRPVLWLARGVLFLVLWGKWGGCPGRADPPAERDPVLRELLQTRSFQLGRPVQPLPTPDGQAVLFLRSEARSARLRLYVWDAGSGQVRELLTAEQLLGGAAEHLSPEEKSRRERLRLSAAGLTSYQLSPDGSRILLPLAGKLYLYDRRTGQVRTLATGPGPVLDPQWAPDGKKIAYVRGYDLYVFDLEKGREWAVTQGGTAAVSHGLAEFIAQEEMDRYHGYWWSPDSQQLAYEEADARAVEVWYLADPFHPEAPPAPQYYPRPGRANVRVRLGLVSVQGGPTRWVTWDQERYPYLGRVYWPADGPLLLTVQSRDQRDLLLLRVAADSGQTTQLLQESDPAWVNLRQDVPWWLGADSGFLWASERAGAWQLEWYTPQGKLRRVLVPPEAGFQRLVGVDPHKQRVLYQASADPRQTQLFWVALHTPAAPQRWSLPAGLAQAVWSPQGQLAVVTLRPQQGMPRTEVYDSAGQRRGLLPAVAAEAPTPPQVEYVLPEGEQGFYAAVLRPHHFRPGQRYPVLVDVYGGPHVKQVVAAEVRWLLDQWYADQGFLVVALDGRGTPDRGRAWERALRGRLGLVPLADQVRGLCELGRRFPEMDLRRVGIFGWSFGGYLATLAVLKHPEIFHAAAAGAPVVDWYDYDTHYTERYLGVPPAAAEAYRQNSLLTYAPQLRRPLLVIHGTADDNVYFRHTLRLVDALLRAGRPVEVLPLPGFTHMVPDPTVAEALHRRICQFFQRHLGKAAPLDSPSR